MEKTKPFNIPKKLFVQAFKLVKKNAGVAGIDRESIEDFERNLRGYPKNPWHSPIQVSSGLYLNTIIVRKRLKITRFRIFHEKIKTNYVARRTYPLDAEFSPLIAHYF